MRGAQEAQDEYEVEDVEEEDACGDEDGSGDGEAGVGLVSCPCHAEAESDDAEKADVDEEERGSELLGGLAVVLEDEGVPCRSDEVEHEHDGTDRNVDRDICGAADRCYLWQVWWSFRYNETCW